MTCLSRWHMGYGDAACAVGVTLPRPLNFLLRPVDFFCEIPRDQIAESLQGDAVCLPGLRVKPVAEMEEALKRRALTPEEGRCLHKITAVAHEVPVAGEAAQALDREKIDQLRLQDFVRRLGTIHHAPFAVR